MNVYNCFINKIENEEILVVVDTEKESDIKMKISLYEVFSCEKASISFESKYQYSKKEIKDIEESIFHCLIKYVIKNTSKIKSILKI